MSKTKNVTVKVRMTAEEKAKLKRYAKSKHISLSFTIREAAEMYMKLYK